MVRSIIYPLLGVLLAMAGVALVQGLGHQIYGVAPVKEGMTPEEINAVVRSFLETAPL